VLSKRQTKKTEKQSLERKTSLKTRAAVTGAEKSLNYRKRKRRQTDKAMVSYRVLMIGEGRRSQQQRHP